MFTAKETFMAEKNFIFTWEKFICTFHYIYTHRDIYIYINIYTTNSIVLITIF